MSQGCVQILSDLLGESSMVMMALEGIERVLSVGDLRVVRSAIASHSHADQVCAYRCDTSLCRPYLVYIWKLTDSRPFLAFDQLPRYSSVS